MRRLMVLFVLGVLLVACSGSADEPATSTDPGSTPASSSSTATSVAPASTTTVPTTTTAETTTTGATTTSAPTTTTTTVAERPVTEHPNLPSALGGHLVDWDAVGPGWFLVLYDTMDMVAATPGPTVLYLVSPSGDRYEVATWASGPYDILDWAGTGDAAMVLHNGGVAAIVDLRTGVETSTIALPPDWYSDPASFTSPTGMNVVVLTDDGTTQRVERRDRSGAVLAVLGEQASPSDVRDSLGWLYGYDGTFALIRHAGGIEYVANDGTFVRDLWTPMAHRCSPVRWWDADTFVAACIGEGPAFPDDYSQVWLLETDGTAGSPLTTIPPGPIAVVDFGHSDAWEVPGHTIAQWWGDCGSAGVREVAADGSVTSPFLANGRFLEIDGSEMVLQQWAACDMSEGLVVRVDFSGAETAELVPRIGDSWGVRDAESLAAMYP